MRRLLPGLALVLLAAGCTGTPTTEGQAFAGRWQSIGFGTYLVIGASNVDLYEHTSVSCGKVLEGSAEGISAVASIVDGQLVIDDGGRVVRYDPVDALPAGCEDLFPNEDPLETFAIIGATMVDHYAFLDERAPEFADRHAEIGARLTAESTDQELFDAVTELLRPLADAQVRLIVDNDEILPDGRVWAAVERPPAVAQLRPRILEGTGLTDPEIVDMGSVVTGRLPGGAGYIGVTSFAWLDEDPEEAETQLARALDGLLSELGSAPGLVIDLRANPGGFRGQALLIASRFVPSERTVARYEARIGGTDEYTDAGSSEVTPMPTGVFLGNVVVMIGPGTVGAAELLALALRGLPNVTLVGENTAGSLAPLLARTMPNGWSVGMSNIRAFDTEGHLWDITGIPPDVEVPTTEADLQAGTDPALAEAERLLGG